MLAFINRIIDVFSVNEIWKYLNKTYVMVRSHQCINEDNPEGRLNVYNNHAH